MFIINPTAGKGRGQREWEQVAPKLSALADFQVRYTTERGHATRLARDAAEKGYDRVVSVGGDGTAFEVLNGVCGSDTAMAILPGGTGNDYAKCVGLPTDMFAAARTAVLGRERSVDIGRSSNGVYFMNVAGAGFDAEVAARVNRYPKYFGGTIPYVAGILQTLWQYAPQEMEIALDDRVLTRKVWLIAAGLGKSYASGIRITPDAEVDDGWFDVCIGGDLSRAEILQLMPKLYSGEHVHHPKVEMARCRRISLRCQYPATAQADGEVIGLLPMDLELLPGYLKLVSAFTAAGT